MDTPLIYLAFANDDDRHLKLLKEESRRLFAALEPADRKGYIKVYREESARVDDLYQGLTRYPDQVAIFHYAGHAEGTALHLEGGQGHAQGLATLLGEQAQLQLVFLNGCSTYGQVKGLLEAGVKAVIATSVPIEDSRAMEFAQQFYEGLAHRRSIGQAFKLAESYLRTRHGEQAGFRFGGTHFILPDTEPEHLPWGLYLRPEHEQAVLEYRLPYYRKVGLPEDMRQYISRSFEANLYLVEVLDEMCKYNPDIYAEMLRMEGGVEKKKDSSEYPDIIMSHFPWPIGSQIRLLFQAGMQDYSQARIRQLLSLYLVTSQLLYYLLLSDVWEWLRSQGQVPPASLDLALPAGPDAYLTYDWLGRFFSLYAWFRAQGGEAYVGEFEGLAAAWADPESGLQEAQAELQRLIGERDALPGSDLPEFCLDVEYMVALVLGKVAFLSRYRMLTVRDIKIDGPRYQQPAYELDLGDLRLSSSGALALYSDDSQRRKDTWANTHSILLAADENKLDQALNLSPFVMDKNTFLGRKGQVNQPAHVFLLAWLEGEKGHFLTYNLPVFAAVESPAHQVHTGMTVEDFAEGRNVTRDSGDASQPPRSSLRARRAARVPVASPPAFGPIAQQLVTFLSDIDSHRSQVHHE